MYSPIRLGMISLATSWLFVRGSESVYVVRNGLGIIVLSVHGPGPAKAVYAFDDEASAQNFLVGLQHKLLAAQWSFDGENVERRREIDPRASSGIAVERRRSW